MISGVKKAKAAFQATASGHPALRNVIHQEKQVVQAMNKLLVVKAQGKVPYTGQNTGGENAR